MKDETIWDVAVIGGGPAGMMAAGRAAQKSKKGAKVILLEKNEMLGKKLLITGGGRCNVTNAEFDNRKLLEKFKGNGKYLFSAFSEWSVEETLDFFHAGKMETKVEALQRVFPVTDKAKSAWDVLVNNLKQNKVTVLSKNEVMGFEVKDKNIASVKLKGGRKVRARQFILATGGKSRPETGSTGDGFRWLRDIGHTVVEPTAALVPVAIKDAWIKNLQGITLQKVKISLFQNDMKQGESVGRLLFTHFGLSGPTILNMSRDISELLKYDEVVISLDVLPDFAYDTLNKKLQEILKEHSNKKFKNCLGSLILPSLASAIVKLSGIDPEIQANSVTREERLHLVKLLKAIPLRVKGLLGVEKAVVTSGGVKLDEVDFKTMRSRLYPNLFLVGDILDIDRPSGGYSLQLCWTTGYVAGNSVDLD